MPGARKTTAVAIALLLLVGACGGGDKKDDAAKGFEAMDDGAIATVVDELIAANADAFQRFKDGDQKVTGFFVGGTMKATQGKADGKVVTRLLQERAQA